MSLPTLLAGPILRRVDKKQASVWMAFSKAESNITLKIWEGDSISHDSTPGDPLISGSASTKQFGKNLHLVVVTAKFEAAAVGFDPTKIYSYEIIHSGGGLNAFGLLGGADVDGKKQLPLGYADKKLPAFALPSGTTDHLILAQGSCRKMHGHGEDALAYLDDRLSDSDNYKDPTKRFQQLFLTGDQIYADDVPGILLKYATGSGADALVGDDEKVRIPQSAAAGNNQTQQVAGNNTSFPVFLRQHLVTEYAGFTSSDADCHLITFGEYCATYLHYWNVRAWNSGFYNKMKELAADHTKLDNLVNDLFDNAAPSDAPALKSPLESALTGTLKDFLFTEDERTERADAAKKAEWLAELKEKLKDELRDVVRFFETLPKVSRVLANTPTYMIFDDHEVTDDWNITKRWRNQVFTKAMGRDIIRNGMMAYAIFQDWGNVPNDYETGGSKAALLDQIVQYGAAVAAGAAPSDTLVQSLETALGIGAAAGQNWHYSVDSGVARTLVLNTRTEREYGTLNAAPGLLGETALNKQVPENPESGTPFTLVISPVPVLGLSSFEELIQPGGAAGIGVFSGSGKNKGILKGALTVDVEAWGFNPEAFERLLARLNTYGKVIFVSGDVHYGFSASLDYWKGTTAAPGARFIQLTSSALKNAWFSNLFFFQSGFAQRILTGFDGAKLEKLGWKDKQPNASGTVSARNRARLRKSTAVIPVSGWTPGATISPAPDFKWRMKFQAHEDDMEGDPFSGTDIDLANETSLVNGYKNIVIRHQDAYRQGFSRRLVWPSNCSTLTFSGAGDALKVSHRFFYRGGPENKVKNYITHEFDLKASGDDATAPNLP